MAKATEKDKEQDPEAQPEPTIVAQVPAPKGVTLEGMDEATEIEIIHPVSGQTYGVSVKAFKDLYAPAGFEPMRMGDSTLLPGDPRAPDPSTIPADNPPVMVNTPEPEADGATPEE